MVSTSWWLASELDGRADMAQVLTHRHRQRWQWLAPPSPEDGTTFQAYLLNVTLLILASVGLLAGLAAAILWLLNIVPTAAVGVVMGFGVQPLWGLAYWLGRRGQPRLAGFVPVLVLLAIGIDGFIGPGRTTLIGLAVAVLVADLLLGFRSAMAIALLCTGAYGIVGWLQYEAELPLSVLPQMIQWADVTALALGLVVIALLSRMATGHLREVLQRYLSQLRHQAAELKVVGDEKSRLRQELETRTREYGRLAETLQRLSVTLIPVTDEILILPFAGDVDEERMELTAVNLLDGVATRQARVVIVDLTGVAQFEAAAVGGLVELAQSVHLIGCELLLVGMPRWVADVLADQESLLSEIVILGDLQDGVACALAKLGQRIVAVEPLVESRRLGVGLGLETRSVS
jgi:anti-anti-sigma regulatory factor